MLVRKRTLFRSTTPMAIFLRRSRLSMLVSDAPATPPPPNFEPTRFWWVIEKLLDGRRWHVDAITNLIIWWERSVSITGYISN